MYDYSETYGDRSTDLGADAGHDAERQEPWSCPFLHTIQGHECEKTYFKRMPNNPGSLTQNSLITSSEGCPHEEDLGVVGPASDSHPMGSQTWIKESNQFHVHTFFKTV